MSKALDFWYEMLIIGLRQLSADAHVDDCAAVLLRLLSLRLTSEAPEPVKFRTNALMTARGRLS